MTSQAIWASPTPQQVPSGVSTYHSYWHTRGTSVAARYPALRAGLIEARFVVMATENDSVEDYINAWLEAASDLGITVAAPFDVELGGRIVSAVARVIDFGAANGLLVFLGGPGEWAAERETLQAITEGGFGYSFVRESYARYERVLFIDTLNDWGWTGRGEAPAWYTGQPWS